MLSAILHPKSVAVVGASRDPHSVGYGVLKNLLAGGIKFTKYCAPFSGKVFAVNPHTTMIHTIRCYPSLLAIPYPIDMAIICVPARIVPQIIDECVAKKIGVAVIISAGFSERDAAGASLQKEILIRAGKKVRIIGPNCLGVISTNINLNASFAPSLPPRGDIAFISQSGAIADSIIDWALLNEFGFSTIISYGNQADLGVEDFLSLLEHDRHTKVITLYIEGLTNGKQFMQVAQRVNKKKPIIVLKAGKTSSGTRAVQSHTASLAGDYAVYRAAFAQCGLTVAETVEDLFDIAKVFSKQPLLKKNAVAIVTNGGGGGVLMADYCEELGLDVVALKQSTIAKLDASGVMHPAYSRNNPLDIVGDALPKRYDVAINTLLAESYIHGMMVIQTLQTMTDPWGDAEVVINAHKRFPTKPIICCYLGGKFSEKRIRELEQQGIPDFNELKKAAICMKALWDRQCWLRKR